MKYNIVIKTTLSERFVCDASKEELEKIIEAYNHGKKELHLPGYEKIDFNNFLDLTIFDLKNEMEEEEIEKYLDERANHQMGLTFYNSKFLLDLGKNVTKQLLKNGFGENNVSNANPPFYNFIVKTFASTNYLIAISREDAEYLANSYKNGLPNCTIDGEKIFIKDSSIFKIFEVSDFSLGKEPESFKREFKKYLKSLARNFNETLSILEQFGKDATKQFLKNDLPKERLEKETKVSTPKSTEGKIFISHSSKDKEIVNKFLNVIFDNGLNINLTKEVFCTSLEGSGIGSGKDFKNSIKTELINAKIIIQIISKNYKESEVCLNEMGASWVLNDKVVVFIVEADNYDVGFIHNTTQQLQLGKRGDLLKFIDEYKGILFDDINFEKLDGHIEEFIEFLKQYKITA